MPNLHPEAVKLVARLVEQGRAGERPFGIPLAVWLAAIEEKAKDNEAKPKPKTEFQDKRP